MTTPVDVANAAVIASAFQLDSLKFSKFKGNRKLRIRCDMDAILVDLAPYWLRCIAADHGVEETIDNITQWNLHKCGKLAQLGAQKVYEYLKRPGFFRNAPQIPGGLDQLKIWQDAGHDVMVVTSPSGPISIAEKFEWFEIHAPWLKSEHIVMMNRKSEIRGDVLIDDHPETGVKYLQEWPEALVLGIEYPYNAHITGGPVMLPSYKDYTHAWRLIGTVVDALATEVAQ